MVKLLVLILLVVLLWIALERFLGDLRRGLGGAEEGRVKGGKAASRAPRGLTLTACDGCGVHVPPSRLERHGARSLCDRCR